MVRRRLPTEVTAEAMEAAIDVMKEATTSDFYAAWLKMIITIIAAAIEGQLPDD